MFAKRSSSPPSAFKLPAFPFLSASRPSTLVCLVMYCSSCSAPWLLLCALLELSPTFLMVTGSPVFPKMRYLTTFVLPFLQASWSGVTCGLVRNNYFYKWKFVLWLCLLQCYLKCSFIPKCFINEKRHISVINTRRKGYILIKK